MQKRAKKLTVALAVAVAAWSVPAFGEAATYRSTYGSYTKEYSSWQGIFVNDTSCDNNDVYSDYKRDIGTSQVFRNSSGCNTSQSSGTTTNKIQRFNSCVDDAGSNTCSSTAYRP